MAAKSKKTEEASTDITVFVPQGAVREGDILKAALLAADIPVAAIVNKLEIVTDPEPAEATVDGKKGRNYTIQIGYTPRKTTDDPDVATIENVLTSLEPLTPEKVAEVTGTAQEA